MDDKVRVDIKEILKDESQRKELMVGAIRFVQSVEGIDTTLEQAIAAYQQSAVGRLTRSSDSRNKIRGR